MNYGLETQMDVEVVNTIVTMIAMLLGTLLGSGLRMWLTRRFWEMTSKGAPTDMLVSEGSDGFWEFIWRIRHSTGGERLRVVGDLLPYIVVIAVLEFISFSTSGVSATVGLKQGRSVMVVGSLTDPAYEPIEALSLKALIALRHGERAAPFLLGSPELGNYGTNVSGLAWSVRYSDGSSSITDGGDPDLEIYGSSYTVEQDGVGMGTYEVSTCLVVSEDGGDYTVDTCEGVQVGIEPLEIVVEGRQIVTWSQDGCSSDNTYAVFNQGVNYKKRNLTLVKTGYDTFFTESKMVEGTTVTALCTRIFESMIEACIFEVGSHLYVGDWNPADYQNCDDITYPEQLCCNDDSYPGVSMVTVEVEGKDGTLLASDEFKVAASMFAEVVAGSGKISSRQQLSLILGIFSRMSCMKIGVGTAYYPEPVVMVSISSVVLVLWGLVLVVGLVVYLREIYLETNVFIPSTTWDWFAVGARECLGGEDLSYCARPANHFYVARYGLEKPLANGRDGIITQHLSWTKAQHKYEEGVINGKESTPK